MESQEDLTDSQLELKELAENRVKNLKHQLWYMDTFMPYLSGPTYENEHE